jgi:hypothetical protein
MTACWPAPSYGRREESDSRDVNVTVDVRRKRAIIPADFIGLGYEISSVAVPGLLNEENRTYLQLLRTLSAQGVIRVGGNTSDDSSFATDKEPVSAPKGTVVNEAVIKQLGAFVKAANWQLIWGLNLGSTDESQAVAEAEAVERAAKTHLLAFEIGNEPDLFGRGTAHRPKGYGYDDFLREYRRYKTAIRAKLPQAPFAGPDVAGATAWVTQFAKDEGRDLKLLTHHYYRECASPTSTLDKLFQVDPKLAPELAQLRLASASSRLPYRICETNSFCGGGKPGVSDSFGAALWVLDFMFRLAEGECAGVNMETGVNQHGFVSSYSPIRQNEGGAWFAAPEYYGMLAFAQASKGSVVDVDCDAGGGKIAAYAVTGDGGRLSITIINKETALDANVRMTISSTFRSAQVLRLTAPSLTAKDGVTLGGSPVSPDGRWAPRANEVLTTTGGKATVHVPAGSAAVLQWVR